MKVLFAIIMCILLLGMIGSKENKEKEYCALGFVLSAIITTVLTIWA